MCRTIFEGWKRYKDYPDARVRERFARDATKLRTVYTAALWAMARHFRNVNQSVSEQIRGLRSEIEEEFGVVARMAASRSGAVIDDATRRAQTRRWMDLRAADHHGAAELGII